jgi:branched-chain amino acid transport system permease protein
MNWKGSTIFRVLGGLIVIAIPFVVTSDYWLHLFIMSGIYVFLCLGANLLMGYTGQVSLAFQSFYAIGAYTAALLTIHFNLPFIANFVAAGIASGIVGLVLGLPAIRLSGHYLAIASLGFAVIIEITIQNWDSVTKGYKGLTGIKPPGIALLGYQFGSKASYYFLILSLLVFTLYFFGRLVSSKTGRAFRAIRENEIAARASGINVSYYKLLAFAISSLLAGFGGAFYAQYILFVSPEIGGFGELVNIFAMTIVGGIGSIPGSVIGATFLTFLPEMMRALKDYRLIIYGSMLLIMILFMPKGIWYLFVKLSSYFVPFSSKREEVGRKQMASTSETSVSQRDIHFPATVRKEHAFLKVDSIDKSFSGVRANSRISFEIEEGQILSIIGPNGSGKTTLLNVISGYYPSDSGTITFSGRRIDRLRPDQIAALGLVRTFQISRLFHDMTVMENLLVGMHLGSTFSLVDELLNTAKKRRTEERLIEKAAGLLKDFDVSLSGREGAAELPYGLQRNVEIMRAIGPDPRLVLLDEPACGMNLHEVAGLKKILKLMQGRGTTIILVEHVMDVVMDISDRIIVLNYGKQIAEGSPDDIQSNLEVKRAYLGEI